MTEIAEALSRNDPVAQAAGFVRLTRDSVVYALGSVAGKVIGVLMLPILTRFLPPDEYGRLDLLSTLGSAAISALLLGLDVSTLRLAIDPNTTAKRRAQLYGAWALIGSAITIPIAALFVLFASPLSQALFGEKDHALAVATVGVITVAGTYQIIGLTILRAQVQPFRYALVGAATLLLNAMFAVVLLILWRRDATSVLAALAISLAAGAVAAFLMTGFRVARRPQKADALAILTLGLPLAPAVVATWIAEFINRAILLGQAGAHELGYLSVALRFASIAGLAVVGFQMAWQPHAFALGLSDAATRRIALDGRRILVSVSALVVAIAIATPELVTLASPPGYSPAISIVGLALVTQLATGLYLVCSMPSAAGNAMKHLGIAGVVGVAVAVVSNLVAAGRFGAAGTAGALGLGQLVAAVVVWGLGRRIVAVPLDWRRVLPVLAVAAAMAIASTAPPGGLPLGGRLILALLFVLVLIAEGTLRDVVAFVTRVMPR